MSSCHSLNGYLPLRVDAQLTRALAEATRRPHRDHADVKPAQLCFCHAASECREDGSERLVIQSQRSLTFEASIFDMGSSVFVVQQWLRRSTGGALIPVAQGETSHGGRGCSCRSSQRVSPSSNCVAKKKKAPPFMVTVGPDLLNVYTWATTSVFLVF